MEVQCTYTHICMTRLFFTKKESKIGSDEGELAVLLPFCHIVLVKTIKGEYVKSDGKKMALVSIRSLFLCMMIAHLYGRFKIIGQRKTLLDSSLFSKQTLYSLT